MRSRILLPLTAAALAGAVALYGIYAKTPPVGRNAHANYTTTEILEFLAFSTGRVVADHPTLNASRVVGNPPEEKARSAAESLSLCLRSVDAVAANAMTAAFDAADPQRLDPALRRVDAAMSHWLNAPHKQYDPCPPPPPPPKSPPPSHRTYPVHVNGIGLWNYVFLGENFLAGWFTYVGVVAFGYAVLVASFVLIWTLLVPLPIMFTYQFDNEATDLDRQNAIATMAKTLRS